MSMLAMMAFQAYSWKTQISYVKLRGGGCVFNFWVTILDLQCTEQLTSIVWSPSGDHNNFAFNYTN